jgi:DNA-binding LacI/PurR family transcriptional regulator
VLEENMVDGLIISLSGETKNIDYYKSLIDQNYPIVFFNRYNDTLSASKVVFDDYKWSFFVTEHLIKQGYKKIFHLSAHQYILLAKERIRGYKKAMNKYHLPLEPTWIVEAGLTVEEGEMTMQKLIDNNNLPEAITCATDMLALGVVKCCKRNGIKIPDDIALTGFSEIPFAELIDPPLTSVLQPTYEMGEIAAKLLLKQIDNESTIPETVILNGTLNIRQSSQKLQNKGE